MRTVRAPTRPGWYLIGDIIECQSLDRPLLADWHDPGFIIQTMTKSQFSKGHEVSPIHDMVSYHHDTVDRTPFHRCCRGAVSGSPKLLNSRDTRRWA